MARSGCYEVVFAIETRKVASDRSLEDESESCPLDVHPIDEFPALVAVLVESPLKLAATKVLHLRADRRVLVLLFSLG